jgi:spermidine synthase
MSSSSRARTQAPGPISAGSWRGAFRTAGIAQLGSATWLFSGVVFFSAFLVFLVEPLAGKLILPLLGGAPAVWNTALAFFQLALLAGYAYAHLLQKWAASLKLQWTIHIGVLALAALTLPLGLTTRLGGPDPSHPIGWILGVLTLSIGAPFFALSATAPLAQAWFAQTAPRTKDDGPAPIYALYAASNLGSLMALVSYPALIEPLSDLGWQRFAWSAGFLGFASLMAILGFKVWSAHATGAVSTAEPAEAPAPTPTRILIWIGIAAVPSSLLMGVTTHLASDVASAPFLWVVPLAIYLLTFVLAFSARQWVKTPTLLTLQALAMLACVFVFPINGAIGLQMAVHLGCFGLTAWMCHQILADQRPDPRHLTLFYLSLSVGGVVGGSFNAFVAPVVFDRVAEYPLVLMLAALTRPWHGWRLSRKQGAVFAGGLALLATFFTLHHLALPISVSVALVLLLVPMICAVSLRDRALYFAALVTALFATIVSTPTDLAMKSQVLSMQRSFFGVVKVTEISTADLGRVRLMLHGTTTHGAQSTSAADRCLPLTYYGVKTGIGRTMLLQQAAHPRLNIAVIGLGAGTLATYLRPQDRLTYYEIDPLVAQYASDPRYFTYLSQCARGATKITLGDGRLSLKADSAARYDLLVVDAFSSDSVPAHLLTVEAMKLYFQHLTKDGIILFHISNRHLALAAPLTATLHAAGAASLHQIYTRTDGVSFRNMPTEVVVAARTPDALHVFASEPGFATFDPADTRPWTDGYTNLIGAMLARR